ncbi:PqqD family peptide modification chaperone [Hydrogenophaga sp.]|uniref:PqqD family peptide modification chaperone n=1 Tax=Hydrogenophaga sp. TaxID=1904254 RepID=UPI003F71CAEB
MKCVVFEGHRRALAFLDGTESLLDRLQPLIGGWSWREVEPTDAPAGWWVARSGDAYVIEAPWLDAAIRETSAVRAAGHLAVDLVEGRLADHPEQLCLHCGAAEWDGRLVLFPGRAKAGKSTLMARLAADGVRVLADDVLPTCGSQDEWGWSFGLAPRIRMPLPADAGARLEHFMQQHVGPGDEDARYLLAPADVAPRHGHRARIGAIVLLERSAQHQPAELSAVASGEGLASLIVQNLAPELPAADLVARLHRIVMRVPCLRLRYRDLDDACRVLQCAFSNAPRDHLQAPRTAEATAWQSARQAPAVAPSTIDPARVCRQAEDLAIHRADGEVFLVNRRTQGIHRLNDLGGGIWRLLEQPTSLASALQVVAGAYPQEPVARVETDLRELWGALLAQGLIRPVE